MPKESCEITIPKTDKENLGNHVETDTVKNLELIGNSVHGILII